MELNFIIEDAIANPLKFTLDGEPTGVRANFDQRRYAQTKHATVDADKKYNQLFEKADPIRIEFYSNFPLNRCRLVDCEDNQIGAIMIPSVAVDYKNKQYRAACKFSSIDGQLFAYFAQGLEYLDEDFTEPGDLIAWNGRLPNINAQAGDPVRYSLDGGVEFLNAHIVEVRWNPELQAEGYILDVAMTLVSPIDGLIEITYDEKPANLWHQVISLAAVPAGKYFVKREHGVAAYDVIFTSEPLEVAEEHEGTLALEYRHEGIYNRPDLWNYQYLFDWFNVLRIPADFYKFIPAGEIEVDINDNGVPRILRAVPFRQLEISFLNMPAWLADKLQMALSHDVKIINGYEYEVENFGQFEMIDRMDLGTYTVVLRQKNDRAKKTDTFTYVLTAEFVPPTHHAIAFGGAEVASTFVSNTAGVFSFLSLPAWLSADKATFVNGDVITFTVAANATLFDRAIILTAVTPTIDGLEATLSFAQYFDNTPPAEFLEVNESAITLAYPAGANWAVLVNASGAWTSSNQSGFAFGAVAESGGTVVRISSATINNTGANRVGVVRLTLDSNPAIFQDITVTQGFAPPPPPQLISVLPTLWNSPNRYATRNFLVDTEPGCRWQVYTSEEWIHCSTALHVGDFTINVQIDAAEFEEVPREGVVTLVNIDDPYDTIVIPIEQN